MRKSEARKLYKEKRKALSAPERAKLDDLLLIQLQTIQLPFITFLLSYWPIEENHEPGTHLFTDYLEFKNPELIICYPKSNFPDHIMQAVQTNDDTRFRKNQYNLYEPEDGIVVNPAGIDMIFVPLLSFDKKGFRIGYGKGFYDRYLSQCRSECLKIGFSYFGPLDSIDDTNEFDVPLNLCVTPTAVYVF
ncbi:MAG TPA: 5-formyltetrahydrofolate cyclo-ligase [Chitinophagaceae bacterium]|nr:5-formyltetrahydrofolate cyclo-ligase [Chitinophagaceae bacterium]